MVIDAQMPDRRAALKARHRRAILDAAKALIEEDCAARFSVDQLAARADVSRRTIFNHFASIDDVVTTVCTEVLGVVIDTFRTQVSAGPTQVSAGPTQVSAGPTQVSAGPTQVSGSPTQVSAGRRQVSGSRTQASASAVRAGSRAEMFETVAAALRATDVPGTVAFLWQALGGFSAGDPRPQQIFQATFSRTTADLARELAERHPERDPLEAELLVSSLMHGTEVIAHHWIADTGAATDDQARAHWHDLLDRLIDNIRTGY